MNKKGINLIEIVGVILIISLISLFLIPKVLNIYRYSEESQITNDLRIAKNEYIYLLKDKDTKDKYFSNIIKADKLKGKKIYSLKGIDSLSSVSFYEEKNKDYKFLYRYDDFIIDKIGSSLKGIFLIDKKEEIYYVELTANDLYLEGLDKYNIKEIGKDTIEVIGFNKNFKGNKKSITDLSNLEAAGKKIEKISGFDEERLVGRFPNLNNLKYIEDWAFDKSHFSGNFPNLKNIKIIGKGAFYESNFTGTFPKLSKIENIDTWAFDNSEFTGKFPIMETLKRIGRYAFLNSNFSNVPDHPFYRRWNGEDRWVDF